VCTANGQFSDYYAHQSVFGDNVCWKSSDQSPEPVGGSTRCRSADEHYAAVLHMFGNVAEWEDGCEPDWTPESRYDFCLLRGIAKLAKRIYRVLGLSGYARIDLRLAPDGRVYVLEANPNPDLKFGEDFAESASSAGIGYPELLQRILTVGMSYPAEWKRSEIE
jgi:hypothetical protein